MTKISVTFMRNIDTSNLTQSPILYQCLSSFWSQGRSPDALGFAQWKYAFSLVLMLPVKNRSTCTLWEWSSEYTFVYIKLAICDIQTWDIWYLVSKNNRNLVHCTAESKLIAFQMGICKGLKVALQRPITSKPPNGVFRKKSIVAKNMSRSQEGMQQLCQRYKPLPAPDYINQLETSFSTGL